MQNSKAVFLLQEAQLIREANEKFTAKDLMGALRLYEGVLKEVWVLSYVQPCNLHTLWPAVAHTVYMAKRTKLLFNGLHPCVQTYTFVAHIACWIGDMHRHRQIPIGNI
jgi:hypothetical protein